MLKIDSLNEGYTVKHVLKKQLMISERLLKKLKYNNKIKLNSVTVNVNVLVNKGDILNVNIDFEEDVDNILPEPIDIDVIYEDECVIAINKKPNMVVHPTFGHQSGTVANAIIYYLKERGIENKKIRPVSRLDRDTTGVIIFAKNQYVQEVLARQMKDKIFKKEYLGIVNGILKNKKGTIDVGILRAPDSIMLRHTSQEGIPSITHYSVLKEYKNHSLLKFCLETGRTHQIRVHCQHMGHSLLGDTLYSDIETNLISRQALHSYKVEYICPIHSKKIEIIAPLADDIKRVLEGLNEI